ncbi:MAG: IS66 family transposase [Deltaproteobacteria bacterium]|nr:IS66 family transposase [Deltaproteobacteria bacterium]
MRALLLEMLAAERGPEAIELVLQMLRQIGDRNAHLELEQERLLRKHLGRTSEKISPQQLSLLKQLLGEPSDDAAVAEATLAPPEVELPETHTPKRKKGHGRRALPEHLPRVEIIHTVPEAERACPTCGGARACIGHEQSEVLEFVPASFKVEVHKREKLACSACAEGVATAPAPDKVIEKGRPGPGLPAQVVVAKYADHLPLTRQRTLYLREGVELPVSTLTDWVTAVHSTIAPLCVRIGEHAIVSHVLQADDTGINVLDQDAPGGAKRGHLWCYVGDATWASFTHTPDWRKEGPQSYLAARRGWLVADAYKGYDGLFTRPGATPVEVACWAHARRPFAELALGGDARAAPVIELVRKLYEIEECARLDGVSPEERQARRQRESLPLVDAITAACITARQQHPPSDPLAKAAGYVINQNGALRRFLEDGLLPIDNTLTERRLRPIATGRKNYLFCGSDARAERAASMYTLLGTCAMAGVDPRAYLTDVLRKLETQRWPWSRLDELLPPNWAKTAPDSARIPTSR